MIRFTQKYLNELCIGGFIAQKVNKNHSYRIYRMIDLKLWHKKTFSLRSIRQDHILNEIVHFRLIDITANKIYFCFQIASSLNSQFFVLKWRRKNKNPYFSAYYFSEIIFNSSLYEWIQNVCETWMPTPVTISGHMLNTACLQTVSRSVTSIKARWLEHRNMFGL